MLILGNFGVLSFLRFLKLTRFLTSATSFRIWTFSAFLYISETTRTNFFKISSHNLHNVYQKCLKLSLRLIHCNALKFQDKPILRTGQKSSLQHSLFWRYANFSKVMRTIECFHMTSRRPYWCPKTMRRRPCWCPKPALWEWNSSYANSFFCSNKFAYMLASMTSTF